jgi:hypothetical protein
MESLTRWFLRVLMSRSPGVASVVIAWAAGELARVHGQRCGWRKAA